MSENAQNGNSTPIPLGTVILGVAASDAHAVANQLIAESLRLAGFTVVNLGVCTPLDDFAASFEDYPDALAVAIGSTNGHAFDDLRALPELRRLGRLACPIVLGGNLSVGHHKTDSDWERLLHLGVDHIAEKVEDLHDTLMTISSAREPYSVPARL